jgi:hypothetical protein
MFECQCNFKNINKIQHYIVPEALYYDIESDRKGVHFRKEGMRIT